MAAPVCCQPRDGHGHWLGYPPGNGYISHQTGKGKSSTQNAILGGYVSSLEGMLGSKMIQLLDLKNTKDMKMKTQKMK